MAKKKKRALPNVRNMVALGMALVCKSHTMRDRRKRRPKDARHIQEAFQ